MNNESDHGGQDSAGPLHLGQLDFTSDTTSLSGLAQRLDDLGDGSLLNNVLDGGKFSIFKALIFISAAFPNTCLLIKPRHSL
jgi:hypothetical protein